MFPVDIRLVPWLILAAFLAGLWLSTYLARKKPVLLWRILGLVTPRNVLWLLIVLLVSAIIDLLFHLASTGFR